MTLIADTPQNVVADRPSLVDVDAYIASVEDRYVARGEIAPIWYLILAGGRSENAGIFDGDSRTRAKSDIGDSPFHPQARSKWDNVDYSDTRIMTRQELYQPLHKRIEFFTWRNAEVVARFEREVGDTYLRRIGEDHSFTQSLFYQLQQHGHLTVRQIEALQQQWQREDAKPVATPAPSGRTTVTGTVRSMRDETSRYGTVTKMLVQDATGFTTWGSVPNALEVQVGDKVQFDATIKPANDVTHSFFSRPTKAQSLEALSV
ncbi:MAG: hypothetical protein HLX51_01435 [Micrococcaceae bacterium]|nr:hypothetical protein [Micrococcaceae bacterium]